MPANVWKRYLHATFLVPRQFPEQHFPEIPLYDVSPNDFSLNDVSPNDILGLT
jgi:hypothetical protein